MNRPAIILFSLASVGLGACASSQPFPVPSAEYESPAGFSITYPSNGVREQYEARAPQLESGQIRGAAKIGGTLVPYTVRYSQYQLSEQYPAQLVVNVEKGRCLAEQECKPLQNETRTDGPLTITRQRWPDANDSVLYAHMVQRGDRMVKLIWTQDENEPTNAIAEAIAASVSVDASEPAPKASVTPVSAPSSAD